MNYQQTLLFLYNKLPMYQRIGAAAYKADLKNTELLCQIAGHPYLQYPSIHIAGTNGKGSVSNIIASVLQTMGLKTGLYTSPHLKDFRERIRVNGKVIEKQYVVSFVNKYKKYIEEIKPSFFEITFVMAIEYFASQKIDIAIIETGMGGRLDSTNVITPILSIITNVSYDHTQFLGDTLEKIAAEKAGIIKKNIPVIVGESNFLTDYVFINKAQNNNSKLIFADKNFSVKILNNNYLENNIVSYSAYKGNKLLLNKINCPLSGIYQSKNIVTILAAIEELRNLGYNISDIALLQGIENVKKNTGFLGRWEVISKKPLIIFDIAHNPSGIELIVKQLNLINKRKLHMVMGVVQDKDIETILNLLPKDAFYYFCKADVPRALDAKILHNRAKEKGLNGKFYDTVKQAFETARLNANLDDVIFVGGSAFVVAEIL
ncbi:MAG TPA: folylpolyglutamate synthase/dihydrofolate synthase family protein [Bacteroidales bacterium]|nr:folylpolyglutamate synthase/dihydrofolate synthase family protein [Bacteroidales bacterium]